MYLCLNKLAGKVWKKNCPNCLCTLYKATRKLEPSLSHSFLIVFPFFFISNAMNFFIHSLNRFFKKCLHVAGFLQLGALYANIKHDARSEHNLQKSECSKSQWSQVVWEHLDWHKIDFNATKIINVQDWNKKNLMWMEAHIYSVQAKNQTGNIWVKHIMAKAARYSARDHKNLPVLPENSTERHHC